MRHKKEEHCNDPPLQPDNENDQPLHLSCQFCDSTFVLLRELMVHKKRQHEERINICWNYASKNCDFGSENCWFLHTERSETIFECNSCEKAFENQDAFLHHGNKYHKESANHEDPKDSIGDEKDKKINVEVVESYFE